MLRALIIAFLLIPAIAAAKDERKRGGGTTFVQLPTLTASITRPDRSRGVVTVEDGIDVPDEALRAYAMSAEPRLTAAYNQFLSTYMVGLSPGAPANADYLDVQFQRLTDQTLGKPGAKFLLGSILMN